MEQGWGGGEGVLMVENVDLSKTNISIHEGHIATYHNYFARVSIPWRSFSNISDYHLLSSSTQSIFYFR